MAILFSDIEASVRAGTDQAIGLQIPQTAIIAWVNEELPTLARKITNSSPDRYLKFTADFTIAAGNSQDLTAAPTSITDFSRLYTVQCKNLSASPALYYDLPLAPSISPETVGYLSFRARGAATVDIFPTQLVAGQTFRAKYSYRPPKIVNPGDPVDVPDGCEAVLIALCAGRIRNRQEEDPRYWQQERERIYTEVLTSLLPWYTGAPQGIVDITGRYP